MASITATKAQNGQRGVALTTTTPKRTPSRPRRVRHAYARSVDVARLAQRDPEHVVERIALYAADRLAESAREWAAEIRTSRPEAAREVLVEELRLESARMARINGAISGTPFFLAMIPGYLSYLWQEVRMWLRIAALYGHDPGELRTIAALLALLGVHQTVEAAEASLAAVQRKPAQKPQGRRSPRVWVRGIKRVLVLGGFMSIHALERPARALDRTMAIARTAAWVITFVITWTVPLLGVVAMAWACERHTRQLGHSGRHYYIGAAGHAEVARTLAVGRRERPRSLRQRAGVAVLTAALVLLVVFFAFASQRTQTVFGVNWVGLAAVLVVAGIAIVARRRR